MTVQRHNPAYRLASFLRKKAKFNKKTSQNNLDSVRFFLIFYIFLRNIDNDKRFLLGQSRQIHGLTVVPQK